MTRKETFLKRRRSGAVVCVLAFLLLAPAPARAEKGDKKKKGKDDPETLVAEAQALAQRGKHEKAVRAFELAAEKSEKECLECFLGMFRSAVAGGRIGDAVQYAGSAMDAAEGAAADDKGEAVAKEVEAVFRRRLEASESADPDVVWGLLDALGRLGQAAEIVRLVRRHLVTEDEKSLLCAVDSRVSLSRPEALPLADEVNEQLRGLGWDGPFLVGDGFRRPRLRNRSYTAGNGARMAGVVDRRGFIQDVRVVRPPPTKITMDVEDRVRRALFDPATYRGRRIAVCYPFSVTLPGQISLAQKGGGAGEDSGSTSALYNLIQGFDSADAILELVEKAGTQIALPQRAAICAARDWHEELNDKLAALGWPGPYFDTEDVQDPVPQQTPQPEYTEEARKAGVEGAVVLSTVVSETGRVVNVEVVERLPEGLSGQAVNGVRLWTFEPAVRAGKEVAVCRQVTVEFKL